MVCIFSPPMKHRNSRRFLDWCDLLQTSLNSKESKPQYMCVGMGNSVEFNWAQILPKLNWIQRRDKKAE